MIWLIIDIQVKKEYERMRIKKKTFKELVEENKKTILNDKDLLDKVYEKIDLKQSVQK